MKRGLMLILVLLFSLTAVGLNQIERAREQDKVVVINTDFGKIEFALFREFAPKNTSNIIELVEKDFYNGTTFHRIIPGFVVQGGDPNSKDDDPSNDGYGGPGYYIKDEIAPDLKHLPGTVAMAKAAPDKNGSQFYICLDTLSQLDGGYTIVGQVVSGMETVKEIATVETDENDRPVDDVTMNKVSMKKEKTEEGKEEKEK